MADWAARYAKDDFYNWAIVLKDLGMPIGSIGVGSKDDRVRNPNSGAVMRKCGMEYEGTMVQSDWNNQGICDACWYACVRMVNEG